ncbi:MAG: hypothetical protein JJE47_08730 [Acidimicrobiia bacterium]|nr:hypothetical protein [Acidimicrobiia bacterium]
MTESQPNWLLIINRVVGTALWVPALVFYGVSGLVAPILGVVVMWVIGAVWLGVATWWWHRKSLLYAASPALALATWMLMVYLGDRLLGWTA